MNNVPSPEHMSAADLYGFWLDMLTKLADQGKRTDYDNAWKEAVLAMLGKIAINLEAKD